MTVGDLHDWYRRLFGNPEQLGLTPGELEFRAGLGVSPGHHTACDIATLLLRGMLPRTPQQWLAAPCPCCSLFCGD